MPEEVWITRDQILKRIREAGWSFKRKGKRVEIYKLKGSTKRLTLPTNKAFPENYVRILLRQAGLSLKEIQEFLSCSIKGKRD